MASTDGRFLVLAEVVIARGTKWTPFEASEFLSLVRQIHPTAEAFEALHAPNVAERFYFTLFHHILRFEANATKQTVIMRFAVRLSLVFEKFIRLEGLFAHAAYKMFRMPMFAERSNVATKNRHLAGKAVFDFDLFIAQCAVELIFVCACPFGQNKTTHFAVEVMRTELFALICQEIVAFDGPLAFAAKVSIFDIKNIKTVFMARFAKRRSFVCNKLFPHKRL